jgi:hypothetical protein
MRRTFKVSQNPRKIDFFAVRIIIFSLHFRPKIFIRVLAPRGLRFAFFVERFGGFWNSRDIPGKSQAVKKKRFEVVLRFRKEGAHRKLSDYATSC